MAPVPSGPSRLLVRLVPFGSFSGLAVMAATGPETSYLLAGRDAQEGSFRAAR